MKKILTLALCVAAAGTMFGQKQVVDQAAKLSGKNDKLTEARQLIQEAIANPETQNDVRTYYVSGKIEYDAFDNDLKKRLINPEDPSINIVTMGEELVNGYNAFLKALPLDSVPNEKGAVKPKHSKDMISKMTGHHQDYYNVGGDLYNNKHFYPDAYRSFMIFAEMPSKPFATKQMQAIPDSTISLAYFYAGISAFSGNALEDAVKAFSAARAKGITDPQNYVYEIASWQNIAQRDSTKEELAKVEIEKVARDGYDRFGISNPLFINNLINSMLQQDRYQDGIALINAQIAKTPEEPFLYGLRAYINDRNNDEAAAEADYRKAASFPNANAETLKNASRRIYTVGTSKWNALEGSTPEQRQEIKVKYFETAKDYAERAKALDPDDPTIDSILDSINYALTTYF